MRKRNIDANTPSRPRRTPVHEQKDKLTVKQDPNFVYRFVNCNDPKRVEKFKEAGYEVAPEAGQVGDSVADTNVTQTSGVTERYMGGGIRAILMRIPRDWYDEDQANKFEQVDSAESQMIQEAKSDRYGKFEVAKKT